MKPSTAWAVACGIAALLSCAADVVAGKPPPPPPPPPANPAIAFTWSGSLKVMNADGTNLVVLVQATANNRRNRGISCADPDWSPDGSQIVFVSNADDPNGNGLGVYVINRDGTGRRKILSPVDSRYGLWGISPVWSPVPVPGVGGGRHRIAFTSPTVLGGPIHLWIANGDGTDPIDLGGSLDGDEFNPTWSPDGTRLLCETHGSSVRDAFGWVDFAGAGVLQPGVYPAPLAGHDVGRPSWSKRSSNLMLVEANLGWPSTTCCLDLWALDPTNHATAPTRLTATSSVNEIHGSYSPDDSKIVFRTTEVGIEIMNADGTGRYALGISGHQPAWRRN